MTLQAGDTLHYDNQKWFIASANGELDFNFENYGFECAGAYSTGCYHGLRYWFSVQNNQLVLSEFEINLSEKYYFDIEPPTFCGQKPTVYDWALAMKLGNNAPSPPTCGDFHYSNLEFCVSYTGGLLLRDSLKLSISMMLNSSHQKPISESFRIAEIIFEDGKVLSFSDCSEVVANKINHFRREKENLATDSEEVRKEIAQLFHFDYFF